jgi:hypothetical protein
VDRVSSADTETKVEKPAASEGLTQRSGNIRSPSKSDGGTKPDHGGTSLSKADVNSSPIKSTKYSPIKTSPTKINVRRD